MNPFELIKSISSTKKDILENEKDYNAFMVNRGLSYFPDTVSNSGFPGCASHF